MVKVEMLRWGNCNFRFVALVLSWTPCSSRLVAMVPEPTELTSLLKDIVIVFS